MARSRGHQTDAPLYRFHLRRHIPEVVSSLCQVLYDGEYLAGRGDRFAGAYLNPGHFFALSREAATAEIQERADAESENRTLIVLDASLDNVLNLFWPEVLWKTIRACWPGMRRPENIDAGSVLLALSDLARWNNSANDIIGQWAYKNGYSGIKFPSAPGLEQPRIRPWAGGSLRDGLLYGSVGDDTFEFDDLMQEIDSFAANVVVFSGAYVILCTRRFKIDCAEDSSTSWLPNEWYAAPLNAIEDEMVRLGGLRSGELRERCKGQAVGGEPDFGPPYD